MVLRREESVSFVQARNGKVALRKVHLVNKCFFSDLNNVSNVILSVEKSKSYVSWPSGCMESSQFLFIN